MNTIEDSAVRQSPGGRGVASSSPTGPREYRRPQLTVYGSLSDLTRFVGNDELDAGSVGTVVTT